MAGGAAGVCVAAMRQHEAHPNVQHYGLRRLASLALRLEPALGGVVGLNGGLVLGLHLGQRLLGERMLDDGATLHR